MQSIVKNHICKAFMNEENTFVRPQHNNWIYSLLIALHCSEITNQSAFSFSNVTYYRYHSERDWFKVFRGLITQWWACLTKHEFLGNHRNKDLWPPLTPPAYPVLIDLKLEKEGEMNKFIFYCTMLLCKYLLPTDIQRCIFNPWYCFVRYQYDPR